MDRSSNRFDVPNKNSNPEHKQENIFWNQILILSKITPIVHHGDSELDVLEPILFEELWCGIAIKCIEVPVALFILLVYCYGDVFY